MTSKDEMIVLLVDDNPTNLEVLSTLLSSFGFEIAVAPDGQMALDQVDCDPPDLILLDVSMPGIDGFEVCRRLKAKPSTTDIPVIFMTALADTADKVRGLNLGAVDYITKPFQQEEVLARVRTHLNLRALTRRLSERNALLESEVSERVTAEASLEKLTRELEARVSQRTAELSKALLELKQAQESVAAANEVLETEVLHRTEELRQAKERLEIEFAERERSERARAALQEEIIAAQRARLVEMSTPLIPITDQIMVMPLIGTMNVERAQQVLETALTGVHERRARFVIIDVTGVNAVDTEVAVTLMSAARALALLGAKAVITGFSPEMAQAVVALDVDLGAVMIRGTLQSGIAYVLQRSGGDARLLSALTTSSGSKRQR